MRGLSPLAVALVTTAALLAGAAQAPASRPVLHTDLAEARAPLDLVGARFGQTADTDLELEIRTQLAFGPADVDPLLGRQLCVTLRNDAAITPFSRVCVIRAPTRTSGFALRYASLDPAGNRIATRDLPTVVERPGPTTVRAHFAPALLRLVPGLYHWQARSEFGGAPDLLPDSGEIALQIVESSAAAARPRCFGAASRDALHPCVNRRLRLSVTPKPDDAVVAQNSPCTPLQVDGTLTPCEFGVRPAAARATIALVGDSHAAHWRAALEVVAQRRRWRGVSITRSGCPLSKAAPRLAPPVRLAACLRWNDQVLQWLAVHPSVHTIFVAAHFASALATAARGHNLLAAKEAGYRAAWRRLPGSVRRIVVIRDTPLIGFGALQCVRRALARKRDAGRVCAVPRRRAVGPDAGVIAARSMRSRGVRSIDLTPFMCDRRRCFAVVGGALAFKDGQHLTDVFATTLAPYLLRAYDAAYRASKATDYLTPSTLVPSTAAPSAGPAPASR
ncbi:MAG: hypothetical protein QOI73_3277 [Solirubrobacteraceae bacterium]|nr:hypothetical protein [Solirubrobacteraceae bacterium]